MPARFKGKSQVPMAKNFPTGDDRQPPQKIGVVPVILIQKQERDGPLDILDNEITATNATSVGMFNFNNTTDYTGQSGPTVTGNGRSIRGNKFTATGGEGVGISNFDNRILHKNSNDEDNAAAGGKKKSPDKNSDDEDDAAAGGKKKSPEYDACQLAPPNPHSRSLLLVPIALAFLVAAAAYLLFRVRF